MHKKRTAHVCTAQQCAQLLYTTQHRTVLTIFPLNLQTNIINNNNNNKSYGTMRHVRSGKNMR